MSIVEKLRKSGNRVRVTHYRDFVELDGNRRPVIVNKARHEVPDGFMKYALPHGGFTVVEIEKPNGRVIRGIGTCSVKDNFCKREGVKAAIRNAALNSLFK
jgi:hypothetical protein